MSIAIKIENLSKQYRLGLVSTRTLSHDLNRWWQTAVLRREDPYLKIGQENKLYGNSKISNHKSDEYVWALRDINLEVEEGEVLGIIGKNGAGKSTLLKILSKVTAPTTGIVKARGRIASLLEVGTGFHSEMTGRENIYMNGAIMGMTKAEIRRKFDEIVDFAGVERYIDTPVKRYSSGMTVRLGFAVAAHLEPEILVVDEVLAVGDAEFQKKAVGKMQEVSREKGRTVLFVSHNMASIQSLCTKAILLNYGNIIREGEVNNVIYSYLIESKTTDLKCYKRDENPENLIAWINEAYLEQNGIKVDTVLSGQDCDFIIIYNSSEENLRGTFFIGIYNSFGEKLFHLGTQYSDKDNFAIRNKGKIICKIPKMPLIAGQYSVNLSLIINGHTCDRIINAFFFNVDNGDFYGNGKLPDVKENKFLVEQIWDIN